MTERQQDYNVPAVRDAAPPAPLRFTPEKIELLKRTICKGATDDELEMFLYVAGKTGLDPFMRQIHAVKRWDSKQKRSVMSIQTGIDGYRLLADRTGRYAGNDEPMYGVGVGTTKPSSATVTVYKIVGGKRYPFTATARWDEYKQTKKGGGLTFMWVKMPHLMLAKCAEALALRKAFPAELSGIYTNTEMMQADVIEATVIDVTKTTKAIEGDTVKKEPEPEHIIQNGKWTKGRVARPLSPTQLKEVLEFNVSKKADWTNEPNKKQIGLLASKLEEALGANQDAQVNRYTFTEWLAGARSLTKVGIAWIATLLDWLLDDKDESTGDYPFKAYAVKEANAVLKQAMLDQGQQELPTDTHGDGDLYGSEKDIPLSYIEKEAAKSPQQHMEELIGGRSTN